jgi:HAD superfamily hydrolase (TIGR01549 family)
MTEDRERIDTVVLDVDGTLVDTAYHHAMAWTQAFDSVGVDVPVWKTHRGIGMGGDRFVTEVAGQQVEEEHGDALRAEHGKRFGEMIDDVHALPGASALLAELFDRGFKVVLATSGEAEQTDRLLERVDGIERVDARATSDEADKSKPAPDLVDAAIEKAGGKVAAMIGDAVWDVRAALERDRYSSGLLCGGYGAGALRAAGASLVFETPQDLVDHLDDTPLRKAHPVD